ncbi:hypothetical protein ACPZ19_07010 [Amycolatopsis lurida]
MAALVASGGVLWWSTRDWQWIVTTIGLLPLAIVLDATFKPERYRDGWRSRGILVLASSRWERAVDGTGYSVIYAGVVGWVWTHHWWLAAAGLGMGLVAVRATTITQTRRHRVQTAERALTEAPLLISSGEFEAAISACEAIVAAYGRDSSGKFDEHIAKALHQKGFALSSLWRNGEADAVYRELLARFSGDTRPGVRQVVDLAEKEWSPGN